MYLHQYVCPFIRLHCAVRSSVCSNNVRLSNRPSSYICLSFVRILSIFNYIPQVFPTFRRPSVILSIRQCFHRPQIPPFFPLTNRSLLTRTLVTDVYLPVDPSVHLCIRAFVHRTVGLLSSVRFFDGLAFFRSFVRPLIRPSVHSSIRPSVRHP